MNKLLEKLKGDLAKASFTKKLWLYLAMAGVAVGIAVIYLVKDYFNKKAKLSVALTKDDVADAKYKGKITAIEADKAKLAKSVKEQDALIITTTRAIDSAHKAAKKDKDVIDEISSWEDVDSKTRR